MGKLKRLVTLRQAAEMLQVNYKTLWSAVDKGQVESYLVCVGGPRMVVLESAKRWKRAKRK